MMADVRLKPDATWNANCAVPGVRPRQPQHLRVFDYIGFHAYFLTFCTFERSPVFITADAVALVLEQISRAARDCSFAVLAYCFMPDHVHLLVEGRSSKQYRTKPSITLTPGLDVRNSRDLRYGYFLQLDALVALAELADLPFA